MPSLVIFALGVLLGWLYFECRRWQRFANYCARIDRAARARGMEIPEDDRKGRP